ncbi:MAG: hypothetical protein ABEJ92_03285 [Halobacteriales archaeon]
MYGSNRQERPVRKDEFKSMPEGISRHFDEVRDLLGREIENADA